MDEKKTISIDGRNYYLDDLSAKAKAQIGNIRVVDEEIERIERQLAIHKTARATYARELQQELSDIEPL